MEEERAQENVHAEKLRAELELARTRRAEASRPSPPSSAGCLALVPGRKARVPPVLPSPSAVV